MATKKGEKTANSNFWKNPYNRVLSVYFDEEIARMVVWYAYKFSRQFTSHDYSEDILQEIITELHQCDYYKTMKKDILELCRLTVSKYLAKIGTTLSGYTNFRSFLNRKLVMSHKCELTELEMSIIEIESAWNRSYIEDTKVIVISDMFPDVFKYAMSNQSQSEFCRYENIDRNRLRKRLSMARNEYIKLVYYESMMYR